MNRRSFMRSTLSLGIAAACPSVIASQPFFDIEDIKRSIVSKSTIKRVLSNTVKREPYIIFLHPDALADFGADITHPNVHVIEELPETITFRRKIPY